MITNNKRKAVAEALAHTVPYAMEAKFGDEDVYSFLFVRLDVLAKEIGCEESEVIPLLHDLIEPKPDRTCKRVSIYSLFFRESYKGCSECHNPLSALDIYCSKCGAKVI